MALEAEDRQRVAALAHELNNQLTAIRLTAELCEAKLDDRDRIERGLRQIRELGEQATELTEDLLRLGRPPSS